MKKYILSVLVMMTALVASSQTNEVENKDVNGGYSREYVDSLSDALNRVNKYIDDVDKKENNKKIWGRGRYTRLGYAAAQTALENSPVEKGKYAFFYSKGTTYRFPSNAIGGLLKIGFDVVWFDLQFSKYNSPYGDDGWTSNFTPSPYEDPDDFDMNIGRMALNIGAIGIGPNVSVAPLALSGVKVLRPLRVSVYFHYQPSVGMYIMSENGESELSTAFCNMFDLGGCLTYRGISLGMEGRWGQGSFKPLEFDASNESVSAGFSGDKITRKFANTRFYIQFAF